ncbi:Uncharacterised protein [Burkholderia pseudomallei]|nr:Uncharacterised protein [Burkholderia pseudomallei]
MLAQRFSVSPGTWRTPASASPLANTMSESRSPCNCSIFTSKNLSIRLPTRLSNCPLYALNAISTPTVNSPSITSRAPSQMMTSPSRPNSNPFNC